MSGELRSCTGGCGDGDCVTCADEPGFGRDCDERASSDSVRCRTSSIGIAPLQADDDINAKRYVRPPCPDARYPELWAVLMDEWEQATIGKGAERHGTSEPYTEQPASRIAAMCGPGGPFFQACKKGVESERLNDSKGWESARYEILGHAVYAKLGIIEGDRRMRK